MLFSMLRIGYLSQAAHRWHGRSVSEHTLVSAHCTCPQIWRKACIYVCMSVFKLHPLLHAPCVCFLCAHLNPNPPMLCLQGDTMQLSLWLVTSSLAAVLGMEQLEDGVCRAPNGKDGFPGIPGLDGRPGQKGDVGEPGKGEPGMWECCGHTDHGMNGDSPLPLPREIGTKDGHPRTQRRQR